MPTTTSSGAKKINSNDNWREIFGCHNDTCDAIDTLNNNKMTKPTNAGTQNQILRNDGNGGSEWGNAISQQEIDTAVTTWLNENVPTGTTVVVDQSLSVSNAAADAKVTGDELSALKEDVSVTSPYTSLWSNGGITSSTGVNTTSTVRIRSSYIPSWIKSVTPSNGYKICIFAYNKTTNAFVGIWNGSTYATGSMIWFSTSVDLTEIMATYKVRVVGSLTSETSIDVSSADNFVFESMTDASLSKSGKAADAKIVGEKISSVVSEETQSYTNYESVWTKGFLNSTGGIELSSSFRTTDYIDIIENTKIKYKVDEYNNTYMMAFYDATKTFISGVQVTSTGMYEEELSTYPSGTRYIRITLFVVDDQYPDTDQYITIINSNISKNAAEINSIKTQISGIELDLNDKLDAPSTAGSVGQILVNGETGLIWENRGDIVNSTVTIAGSEIATGVSNGYVNGETGERVSSGAGRYTDYIAIPEYTVNVAGKAFLYDVYGVAFYTSGKVYISGYSGNDASSSSVTTPQPFSLVPPAGAAYMCWSLNAEFSTLPSDFTVTFSTRKTVLQEINIIEDDISDLENEIASKMDEPAAGVAGNVLMLDGNLNPVWGNPSVETDITITYTGSQVALNETHGYINATNGAFVSSGAGTSTDYFAIPSDNGGTVRGKAYLSSTYGIAFYDVAQHYISGVTSETSGDQLFNVQIPETAKYMRWSVITESETIPDVFAVTFVVPKQDNIKNVSSDINVIEKYYLDATTGEMIGSSSWVTTDYINVTPAKKFSIQASLYNTCGIAFYDAAKNYVSGISGNSPGRTSTITSVTVKGTIPDGVHYIKSTLYTDNNSYNFYPLLFDYNEDTNNIIEYVNGSAENGTHNILILGDSYSRTKYWIDGLCSGLNVAEVVNLGVTSATVKDRYADRTTYPYTDRPTSAGTGNQNTLASQVAKLKRLITGTDLDTGEVQIYTDHSPDIVVIEGGMNDTPDSSAKEEAYPQQFIVKTTNVYYKNAAGTIVQGDYHIKPDIETIDRTSFAGAYRYIIEEILTLFPNAQIFITTASRFNYFVDNPQYYDTIAAQQIKCARYCAATVIDWNGEGNISTIVDCPHGSGTQEDPYTVYGGTLNTYDGLHPNARGGRIYGRLAANVIKQRFANIGQTG